MNKDKYVCAQLIEFLNNGKFRHLVGQYDGNCYVKHLTCWNQFLALMFGQLSNIENLRDLIVALEAHLSKSCHLGFGSKTIAKTPLSKLFGKTYSNDVKEQFSLLIPGLLN